MPKLKQPASLEAISIDFLLKFVMRYLDELNAEGSSERFRDGVSAIKKDVRDRIPRHFLPEFTTKFLKEWKLRRSDVNLWRKSNYTAALEMLMDVEIVGLRCDEKLLDCVNPRDMHRLRGLASLNIGYHPNLEVLPILENCYLNDLTSLVLPHACTDNHLEAIGHNCPKLRSLRFEVSQITDEGLRALDPCRELRCFGIEECKEISHVGINHLLSVHDKLKDFSYEIWERSVWNQLDGCHFLSCLEKPYLSLERFHIKTDVITDAHLRSIVVNFPNLTHIELRLVSVGDLSILKSLSRLEGISIEFHEYYSDSDYYSAWQSLKNLLTIIGGKITSLRVHFYRRSSILERGGLNFISKSCPNLQNLKMQSLSQDLVVPPFRNLKSLSLSGNLIYRIGSMTVRLENIGAMLNLEWLELKCFTITTDTIKSMMLDDTKFPKLRKLSTFDTADYEIEEIRQFAINQNLDFEIWSTWHNDVVNPSDRFVM